MTAQPTVAPVFGDRQGQAGLVAAVRAAEAVEAFHRVPAEVQALLRPPARRRSPPRRSGRRRRSTGRRSRGRSASATDCAGRSARSRASRSAVVDERVVGRDRVGARPRRPRRRRRCAGSCRGSVSRRWPLPCGSPPDAAVAHRDVEHPVRPEDDRAAVVVGERLVDARIRMRLAVADRRHRGRPRSTVNDAMTVSPSRSV